MTEVKRHCLASCGNSSDEGNFIGPFCAPCMELIASRSLWAEAADLARVGFVFAMERAKAKGR